MRSSTVRKRVLLGLGVATVAAVVATGASGGPGRALVPSNLKLFTSLTLSGSKGAIRAVVYDGNEWGSATTAMTGLTGSSRAIHCEDYVRRRRRSMRLRLAERLPRSALASRVHAVLCRRAAVLSVGPDALKGWTDVRGGTIRVCGTRSLRGVCYVASGDTTESVTLTGKTTRGLSPTVSTTNAGLRGWAVSAWAEPGHVAAGVGLETRARADRSHWDPRWLGRPEGASLLERPQRDGAASGHRLNQTRFGGR